LQLYRRIHAKYGAPLANIATAHKLVRIVYAMLKYHTKHHDPGELYYDTYFWQSHSFVKKTFS